MLQLRKNGSQEFTLQNKITRVKQKILEYSKQGQKLDISFQSIKTAHFVQNKCLKTSPWVLYAKIGFPFNAQKKSFL